MRLTSRQRRVRYASRRVMTLLAVAIVAAGLIVADRYGAFGSKTARDMETYDGRSFRVARVVDGDTLDIDAPGGRHATRVRLWGVDTPETVKPNTPVQHFGPEAGAFTEQMTKGKTVTLKLELRNTRDKYGRLLAYVILPDGDMLNRLIVERGYGYADPRYPHAYMTEFKRLQRTAINARAGLWKDVRHEDLPYYWRDSLKLPT